MPSCLPPASAAAFRLTTPWSPGQTLLASEEALKLDRATDAAAAGGQRVVLSVFADTGTKAPQDAAARDTYCGYVRTLLSRYHSIRDVVVWNEPNKSFFWSPQFAADGSPLAASRYEALLERCYDVLHGTFPAVNVIGLALSSTGNDNAGSASPGAFIRSLGEAYRASGRTAPLMDTRRLPPLRRRRRRAPLAQQSPASPPRHPGTQGGRGASPDNRQALFVTDAGVR